MEDLPVVFEDSFILVIDKIAGLVVTPSETQKVESLAEILQKKYRINLERGGIVHRLDKDTSGLLVVAKDEPSFNNLQAQFKARKTKKEYLCLVHGTIEKIGAVDQPIGRNPYDREKFTVIPGGKEAITEYEPVKNLQFTIYNLQKIFEDFNKIQMRKLVSMKYGEFTLLLCKPLTGRTHQIRVHLKYIGHPIVGDSRYAGRKISRLDKRWCPRQFLHAKNLGFYHPVSGKWMEFESKLPEDLEEALGRLMIDNRR